MLQNQNKETIGINAPKETIINTPSLNFQILLKIFQTPLDKPKKL
jgi:hypothetical protein